MNVSCTVISMFNTSQPTIQPVTARPIVSNTYYTHYYSLQSTSVTSPSYAKCPTIQQHASSHLQLEVDQVRDVANRCTESSSTNLATTLEGFERLRDISKSQAMHTISVKALCPLDLTAVPDTL